MKIEWVYRTDFVLFWLYLALQVASDVLQSRSSGTNAHIYRTGITGGSPDATIILNQSINLDVTASTIILTLTGMLQHVISLITTRCTPTNSSYNYKVQLERGILTYQAIDYIVYKPILLCTIAIVTSATTFSFLAVLYVGQVAVHVIRYSIESIRKNPGIKNEYLQDVLFAVTWLVDIISWITLIAGLSTFGSSLNGGIWAASIIAFIFSMIELIVHWSLHNTHYVGATRVYNELVVVQKIGSFLLRATFVIALFAKLNPELWHAVTP